MAVKDWSSTPASNTGILTGITLDGASMSVPLVDDAFRDMAAQIAAQLGKVGFKGSDMPSAATVDLSTATGWYCDVTGTTTITSLGTVDAGQVFILRFASSLTLTHHASTLILPQNASVVTQGGDVGIFVSLGGGGWRCINYEASGGSMPAGVIVDYGGTVAPSGWLMCYGQAVSRATYASLFTAIGTTYGAGNGSTTFNVPDLRGRVVAGKDDMGGTSANRLTAVINGDILGTAGGSDVIALTTANMPSHTHTQQGSFNTGNVSADHAHVQQGTFATGGRSAAHNHGISVGQAGSFDAQSGSLKRSATASSTSDAETQDHSHSVTIGGNTSGITANHYHTVTIAGATVAAGSDTAHTNMQPTLIMQKIIKV